MAINEQVETILEVFGWKSLLTISCATNVEETYDFLSLVEQRGKYLSYKHRGVYYRTTKKHLKRAFGWTTSSKDETDQHTENEAWRALTWSDKKFRAAISLGSEIREPQLFYLQCLISHKVVARHNGSKRLRVLHMSIMKGLVYDTKVKFGVALAEHWTKIKHTRKGQRVLEPDFLTKAKMIKLRAIRVDEDGEAEWCYEGFAVAPMNEGKPVDDEATFAQEGAQAKGSCNEQPAVRDAEHVRQCARRATMEKCVNAQSGQEQCPSTEQCAD